MRACGRRGQSENPINLGTLRGGAAGGSRASTDQLPRVLRAGDSFGEVGLLIDILRTDTVIVDHGEHGEKHAIIISARSASASHVLVVSAACMSAPAPCCPSGFGPVPCCPSGFGPVP